MARKLKHEKLIKSAGVGYEKFDAVELAEIINLTLLEVGGPTKNKYQKMLNNLSKPDVFLSKILQFIDINFDDCDEIIKEIQKKKESMKADRIKALETEIEEKKKILDELKK